MIAAKQFNPSVLGELWLFENEILTSDELKGASVKVFMDGIAQVDVADFALTIIGPQLQFVVPRDVLRRALMPAAQDRGSVLAFLVGRIARDDNLHEASAQSTRRSFTTYGTLPLGCDGRPRSMAVTAVGVENRVG